MASQTSIFFLVSIIANIECRWALVISFQFVPFEVFPDTTILVTLSALVNTLVADHISKIVHLTSSEHSFLVT